MPTLELSTGFGQYPIADFHHQTEFFEHRDEVVWRDQPATRMTPAQQGFGTGQALAVAAELRLVIQGGLRILERIERADYDVFRRRPKLGRADWLVILGRALRMRRGRIADVNRSV